MMTTSHLKKSFWPNILVDSGFQILDIHEYASGMKPESALILNQNFLKWLVFLFARPESEKAAHPVAGVHPGERKSGLKRLAPAAVGHRGHGIFVRIIGCIQGDEDAHALKGAVQLQAGRRTRLGNRHQQGGQTGRYDA